MENMNMKVISHFLYSLVMVVALSAFSVVFAQETVPSGLAPGLATGLDRLKATLEGWERCATNMHDALVNQDSTRIQSQLGQLRNILVDFPSAQIQIQDAISRLEVASALKQELFARVGVQFKLLEDFGRQAEMTLPVLAQLEGLRVQRQTLVARVKALYERYKKLNDADNANEQAIYARVRESLEWKTLEIIAPRFNKELAYVGHIGRPFKDHPGNAALIAAEQEHEAAQKSLNPQADALYRQIQAMNPSSEPVQQLHATFQRQARILDGMLITIAPPIDRSAVPSSSGASGGLAFALEKGPMARLVEKMETAPLDIESNCEQVARMVLGMTTKDLLRAQGRLGIEGIRRMALGQVDPKWVDAEKADMLIGRFLSSDMEWSFETVRPFMRELLTEAIRRPKL